MMDTQKDIEIRLVADRKQNLPDKSKMSFGKQFADHMLVCDYENGAWQTPVIMPVENLALHPATSAFHYGQAIFEGIKAYRRADNRIAIFRPRDNWIRMNRSAQRLDMPGIPEEIFMDGLLRLIGLDQDWVPEGEGFSLYIRPFMIGTDASLGLESSRSYKFIIITSPAAAYYSKDLSIYIQSQYVRAVPGGTGFTKAAGNYAASLLPTSEVRAKGYDQILWTDAVEHKYVQEIGTMNVFFVVNGTVLTPALDDGTILAGITRASIIGLMKELGYRVEERKISVGELIAAHNAGQLEEAFGSGTAASMSMITQLTYEDKTMSLSDPASWSIAPAINKLLNDIRYGKVPDLNHWVTLV